MEMADPSPRPRDVGARRAPVRARRDHRPAGLAADRCAQSPWRGPRPPRRPARTSSQDPSLSRAGRRKQLGLVLGRERLRRGDEGRLRVGAERRRRLRPGGDGLADQGEELLLPEGAPVSNAGAGSMLPADAFGAKPGARSIARNLCMKISGMSRRRSRLASSMTTEVRSDDLTLTRPRSRLLPPPLKLRRRPKLKGRKATRRATACSGLVR
jgi:hypothetical protein